MNGWTFIILGAVLAAVGGIMATYGWHILPKPNDLKVTQSIVTTNQETEISDRHRMHKSDNPKMPYNVVVATREISIPIIDIELVRVTASPEFAQYETQFSYDIILHNKNNEAISNIHVVRTIKPDKNKQKIALRESSQPKLKPFQKVINAVGPGESVKIGREFSSSYEFMNITVTYNDQYDKSFRSVFEGDRDGLRLITKEKIDN
jgi:putative lipoic acid-binding regulatory protein